MTDPSLLSAYALFLRGPLASPASSAPAHVELLIDREGYLRARRIGLVEHPHDAAADLLRQLDILNHEEPHRAASTHAH